MKGYYAIRIRETGRNYQEVMPCGQLRDVMFHSSVLALAYMKQKNMTLVDFDVVFVTIKEN